MRALVTGATGVLGGATLPLLVADGHDVVAPRRAELDLFDADAVGRAVAGCDAVLHLATRIPPPEHVEDPAAWLENDRLRDEGTATLVAAAIAAGADVFVQPTITFVYPRGPVDERTEIGEVDARLRSALAAERHVRRFADAGGRAVVLRLGLLHGPGTGSTGPDRRYGATLEIGAAGRALVAAALAAPAGTYNVTDAGGPVSSELFRRTTGWTSGADAG